MVLDLANGISIDLEFGKLALAPEGLDGKQFSGQHTINRRFELVSVAISVLFAARDMKVSSKLHDRLKFRFIVR